MIKPGWAVTGFRGVDGGRAEGGGDGEPDPQQIARALSWSDKPIYLSEVLMLVGT